MHSGALLSLGEGEWLDQFGLRFRLRLRLKLRLRLEGGAGPGITTPNTTKLGIS